ncbi:MAG: M23 family metallopeptidase [Paludibacteraceae bacterium]|nr:M23 family metallopeptidase [Paludibacteraceae bacterium]
MQKKDRKLSFFKRLTVRHKVSIINEGTLEEVFHTRLSALGLLVTSIVIIVITLILFSLLILHTPLKGLLPENIDTALKTQITEQALTIDSLTNEVKKQESYFDVIKHIISGDIELDTTDVITEGIIEEKRTQLFMEKSEAEKEFGKAFEEEEMYNISNPVQAQSGLIFFTPAKGIITSGFSLIDNRFGIDITTTPKASVAAAYKGLVFSVGYDYTSGYYLEIIHEHNFITIYRGLGLVFVNKNELVSTGQVIGAVFDNDADKKPCFHFELWNNDQPQNPVNYMIFE